jgi:hypothetical protein
MLIFVQPFGLSSPGGGPRILRSLVKNVSHPFLSICTSPIVPPKTKVGTEIHLPLRPNFRRLERSRLAKYLGMSLPLYSQNFKNRLKETLLQHQVTAIHAIPQGIDFVYAFEVATELGIPYYLNIHDELDYNLRGYIELAEAKRQLAHVWREANGRLVISDAMGKEYARRYGERPYTVVTDGLETLTSWKKKIPPQSLRVYFMGSVHLSYRENFSSLALALDKFSEKHPTWQVSLIIRGGIPFSLPKVKIPIEYLPWGTEAEVEKDFDRVDLLYLPLPFGQDYQSFSRYSLSTKMVTYLGSGFPILYHGPGDAAACEMLRNFDAGILLTSSHYISMVESLEQLECRADQIIANALQLAHSQFLLSDVQKRFWKVLSSDRNIAPKLQI